MTEQTLPRVLVIGGSGFIGTRLLSVLRERGHQVRNLDLQPSATHDDVSVVGDVRSVDDVKKAAADHDVIVNLAAEHRDDVRPLSRYDEVNVGGAQSVVAAAEALEIDRIVFTSTVAVYGLDRPNADETAQPQPFNDYGRTKLLAEGEFRTWQEGGAGRGLLVVRPSVVFGEGNRGNVYTLAKQVSSGRFLMVGNGRNRKSMAYVGNIAEFLADATVGPAGAVTLNFADKPDLSTGELVTHLQRELGTGRARSLRLPLPIGMAAGHAFDLLAKLTKRTFPISAVRIRKFAADTTVNTDRLQATGHRARYDLPEGLRRTLAAEFGAGSGRSD